MKKVLVTGATGSSLQSDDLSTWVHDTLAAQTITLVPLLNIDGAVRMSRVLPGCWHRNRFGASDADYAALVEFVRAPLDYFGLTRGKDLFLTDEQIRIWTKEHGGVLGQLWSDQGVDLWEERRYSKESGSG